MPSLSRRRTVGHAGARTLRRGQVGQGAIQRFSNQPNMSSSNQNTCNICFFGAFVDATNQGVRALAASLVRLASEAHPDGKISLLYGNRAGGPCEFDVGGRKIDVEVVNYRTSPKAKLREHLFWILLLTFLWKLIPINAVRKWIVKGAPWLRSLDEADIVGEICGGDSFSDIYGVVRMYECQAGSFTAIMLNKPLVQLPQTYGPFNTRMGRFAARFILRRSARIVARDLESVQLVRELLGPGYEDKPTQFCPDVAFTLEPSTADADILPPLPENEGSLIGFNISGLLYMGGYNRSNMFGLRFDYKEFADTLARRLLSETDSRLLIVPHVFGQGAENDAHACQAMFDILEQDFKGRVHLVRGDYNQSEIKWIIGKCDFLIGSRMHACIAALSQGIASVGVAYSKKFLGVFNAVGVGTLAVDARQVSLEELIEECMRQLREKGATAGILADTIPRQAVRDRFNNDILALPDQA